jgi:hypothetical protein
MRTTKQCLKCENTFETGGKGNPGHKVVYCSRSCAASARAVGLRREPEEKICPVDGTKFLVGGRGNKPVGTRYCSRKCAAATLRMPEIPKEPRTLGKIGRPAREPKITLTCKQCGLQWVQYAWVKGAVDYCSQDCFHKSRIGKPNPLARREREVKNCENCGLEFVVGGFGNPPRTKRFCGRSCAKQAMWADRPAAHSPAREMTRDECAWFAGLFDGEGCIAWPRRAALHSVRLDLGNTSMALLERILQVTGTGSLIASKMKKPQHNQAWHWCCYASNATHILKQIYPFLIVKKEAAAVALGLVDAAEPPSTRRTLASQAVLNLK